MIQRNPAVLPLPFRLSVQLLGCTLIAALVVAVGVVLDLDLRLGVVLGALGGFLLTLPLQRTLWRLNSGLAARPPQPLPDGSYGVLSELAEFANTLILQQREYDSFRAGLVTQTAEAAAQAERNRLARDLHDSIKQQLFTISMSAAAVQARWEAEPEAAKESLADLRHSTHEAMVEMNVLLQQLSPAPLEKVGLVQALRDQCEALGYRTGAEVVAEFGELPGDERMPAGAQSSLFRIAQEALSNVARHARAKRVWVWLGLAEGRLKLEVRDDGQGFEVESVKGMGLNNIRSRANALQGAIKVTSAPGQGTTLMIQLPLVEPELKEEIVKADHTLNKVLLSGAGGGLLLIAALYYPLRVLVPAAFVAGWGEGSAALGLIVQVVALLIWVGVGYGAARWAKASTRAEALVFGALAGATAGIVAYLGIGAAAAGVAGSGAILQQGFVPTTDGAETVRLIEEALRGVMWWEYGVLWTTLIMGVGLGSVGGGLSPLSQRESAYPWWYLPAIPVLVATVLVYVLTSVVALAIFSTLDQSTAKALSENGIRLSPGLPLAGGLLAAVLTPLAFYFAALIGLYGVLRTHIYKEDLNIILNRVMLVNSIASAYVAGGLTVCAGLMMALIWSVNLSPLMSAVIILNALANFVIAIPFIHLGIVASRRWNVLNNDTAGWRRSLLSVLVLAGVFEIVWALLTALDERTIDRVIVLVVSVLAEVGLIYWLRRQPRLSAPALTRAMIVPSLVPSGVSTLLGTTMVLFASVTAVVPVALALVNITVPLIGAWAGSLPDSANTALITLVQTYFDTQLNTLLIALAFSLGGSAVGVLAIWVIGAGTSKWWAKAER